MAAAATERACTSSPPLVRSRNTGASSHAWIGQARNTLGNPRQCVSEVPASNYSNRRAITAYGLEQPADRSDPLPRRVPADPPEHGRDDVGDLPGVRPQARAGPLALRVPQQGP